MAVSDEERQAEIRVLLTAADFIENAAEMCGGSRAAREKTVLLAADLRGYIARLEAAPAEDLVSKAEVLVVVEEVRDMAYVDAPGIFHADPGQRYAEQDGWARASHRIAERVTALAGGGEVE